MIDAHVHISLYENNAASLEGAFKVLLSDMKKNRGDYAIIIPDNVENDPGIADFSKVQELIKGHNNLFMLGSPQIIQRGDGEISKYEDLLKQRIVKGIKFFPGHDPYFPTDERCQKYYQVSEALNTPVIFHTGVNPGHPEVAKYNDPKYIVEVAQKYPKLKVVITHYFWPEIKYCYEVTKEVSNIYFEIAGMGDLEVIAASGGIGEVIRILSETVNDRPDKVIYGTDWPMCKMEDHLSLIEKLNLGQEVKNKVLFKNAINLYNLPIK